MTQTTRKLIVRAIGDIQIWGLTKGPVSGWSLQDTALVHCGGARFQLTEAAARRVRDAAAQATPFRSRKLTGYEIAQLPPDEAADFRARCQYVGTLHGVHGLYAVQTPAQHVELDLHRGDLA